MTQEEYIKGKIKAGHEIHFNEGNYWESTRFGYCKPAILFEEITLGVSRPLFKKSILGYNHRVPINGKATGYWHPFLMTEEMLNNWEVKNLKSKGRKSSIKKGLKLNNIVKVNDIGQYKESISELLKSVAIRVKHGHPEDYYDLEKNEWWDTLVRVSHYTEFWCAFNQEEELTGYICIHVMGSRVVIDGVKVHTDRLNDCVVDAILSDIILDLKERGNIKEIWYGGLSDRKSLDRYKTSYGFEAADIPYRINLVGGFFKYPSFLNKFRKIDS